jgi:hypothetical protein
MVARIANMVAIHACIRAEAEHRWLCSERRGVWCSTLHKVEKKGDQGGR